MPGIIMTPPGRPDQPEGMGVGDIANAVGTWIGNYTPGGIVAKEVWHAVKPTVEFMGDPLGYMAEAAHQGLAAIVTHVLPLITQGMTPDFSWTGFKEAYSRSWGLGLLLATIMLLVLAVRVSQGKRSSEELGRAISMGFPVFMAGSMLFPPAMMGLFKLGNFISQSMAEWAFVKVFDPLKGSTDPKTIGTVDKLMQAVVRDGTPTDVVGGPIVALLLYALMAVGLVLILVVMIGLSIGQLILAVLVPLAGGWAVDSRRTHIPKALIIGIISLVVTPILIFLLFGLSTHYMVGAITDMDLKVANGLKLLLAGFIFIAACAGPIWLTSWAAKTGLSSGGSAMQPSSGHVWGGRSVSDMPSGGSSSGPSWSPGPQNQTSSFGGSGAPSPGGAPVNAGGRAPVGGANPSAAGAGARTAPAVGAGGAGAGGAGAGGAGAGAASTAGAGASGGAAAAGAGAGGGAAASGAAAAGAGLTATGVGALVGLPLMALGAANKVVEVSQDVAAQSLDHAQVPAGWSGGPQE